MWVKFELLQTLDWTFGKLLEEDWTSEKLQSARPAVQALSAVPVVARRADLNHEQGLRRDSNTYAMGLSSIFLFNSLWTITICRGTVRTYDA